MGRVDLDLRSVKGFMVADADGRFVGQVESPMYGTQPDCPTPSPSARACSRRRHLVPAEAIGAIDESSRVIGLSVERASIRTFL